MMNIMHILDSDEMNRVDRLAAETWGLPPAVLMENAGCALAEAALRMLADPHGLPGDANRQVLVLAGSGNNGGDGLVAARYLAMSGRKVKVYVCSRSRQPRAYWSDHLKALRATDAQVCEIAGWGELSPDELLSEWHASALLIDALLGTGFHGPLRPEAEALIKVLAEKRAGFPPVLAADLPSGVDADNGRISGTAVRADVTVTFCRPKWGVLLYPGANFAGRVEIVDIGVPQLVVEKALEAPSEGQENGADGPRTRGWLLSASELAERIPPLRTEDHKGSRGRVLIIAGSRNYAGAPLLAAAAAARSGAGLIDLWVPEALWSSVAGRMPEAVVTPFRDLQTDRPQWSRYDAVLFGPGLGMSPQVEQWLELVWHEVRGPLVVDADGLNALAKIGSAGWEKRSPENTVFTPHLGEMARLLGVSLDEIRENRLPAVVRTARDWEATVVGKGPHTLVSDGEWTALNPTGNPALATAGSGDVLAGFLTGWLARTQQTFLSACAAVYLHGLAADLAVRQLPPETVTAGELIRWLAPALRQLHDGENGRSRSFPMARTKIRQGTDDVVEGGDMWTPGVPLGWKSI